MLQLTRQVSLRISHQLFYARFLVLSVVAIIALHAPALAAEIVPTRVVAPNGMTVLVLEQHFLPIVEVLALVKTGSAQDPRTHP